MEDKLRFVFRDKKTDEVVIIKSLLYDVEEINKFYKNKSLELISIDHALGIKDKNYEDIFENDYIRIMSSYWNNPIVLVQWGVKSDELGLRVGYDLYPAQLEDDIEIIGNWWENKDEMEEGSII